MTHDTAIVATLAAAFALAFVLGLLAMRLRLPPLVGYLLAGVALGPYSGGPTADVGLAGQLAEIGVILLMFGVGLHFSVKELLAVRRIVVPGALAQMAVATLLGAAVAGAWGWGTGARLVYGLALSVASTVVVLRALEERGLLDSTAGRVSVGWLVVQDLAMVLALVLLPAVAIPLGGTAPGGAAAGGGDVARAVAITLAEVAGFLVVMYVVGRRAVPWLLTHVARAGSRELFTLAVLAAALGIAVGAAALFGVSFALGAFFAGVVISESDLSHKAASDALPLQDAFAVLFFVSVGMLFDPAILVREPLRVLATVLVILLGNAAATLAMLLALRVKLRTALGVAASFGQIGEFSFILAGLGIALGLLPPAGRSLLLAGALLTITANPLLVVAATRATRWLSRRPHLAERLERAARDLPASPVRDEAQEARAGHAILIGYGRVGSTIGDALDRQAVDYVVVDDDRRIVEELRRLGVHAIYGDAARPGILALARPERARLLIVATPDPYHARQILELARGANPAIDVVVRTHSREAQRLFERLGVGRAVMGERELAFGMSYYALRSMGHGDSEADDAIHAMRTGMWKGMRRRPSVARGSIVEEL
ncbi:MAG: cation:proton antiporter [Gemmatimonadaceae bacterium]